MAAQNQMCKLVAGLVLLSSVARASQVEVVLAHHSEDISWLSRIPADVAIRLYTKGTQALKSSSQTSVQQLPNVGRESHTYLHHIVENYEDLSKWTVFTQAGQPSFGYKGHRSGGGHLLAGDDFANYLTPEPSGSRFVYTSVVHLPSMNHLLRAAYCIDDTLLEGASVNTCPKEASQWTPWWDVSDFRKFVASKVEAQHGEEVMDFYRKYINPSHRESDMTAFFPQGARFAVSRDTIHRRPKADYERLLATLSNDEDSYAGYYMEWLWAELFLGHQQPCTVPAKVAPVSHADAMNSLTLRFPMSVERHLSQQFTCDCVGISGGVSGEISGGISGGVSGGISGGVSGGISGGVSGGISGGISGSISGGVSGGVSGGISGSVSGAVTGSVSGASPDSRCVCGDVSGGISGGVSGGTSTTIATVTVSGSKSTTVLATSTTTSGISKGTSTSMRATTVASSATSTTTTTTTASDAIIVAGTLEVELVLQGKITPKALINMFKKAIASALTVSIEHVVKLVVKEIGIASTTVRATTVNTTTSNTTASNATNGSRRLQSNQTKRYEVSYEVMVPSSMNPAEVMSRANAIAAPGSAASIAFQQALEATDGVMEVGKIVSTVPARQVSGKQTGKTPPTDEEEQSWTTVVITSIAIFMVVVSCGSAALVFKRKRLSDATPLNQASNADLEAGVVPLDGVAPSNAGAAAVAPNPVAGIEDKPACATGLVPASADAEAVVLPSTDNHAAVQASSDSNTVLPSIISLGDLPRNTDDTPVSPLKTLISL